MNSAMKLQKARDDAQERGETSARVDFTQAEWDELQGSMAEPIINRARPGEEPARPAFNLVIFVDGEHVAGRLD